MNYLHENLLLIALLLATLVVLALLAVVVSAALRGGAGSAKAGKTLRLLGAESLHLSFRSAVKLIEANLASRGERYNLSWTLLLNESASEELPLLQSGLHSALSADSSLNASAQGIAWNFFDKGVVVQLRSDYLGAPEPDSAASNGVWDDFLGLCRNYRPQLPFDCIVVAIPCAALLQTDPQGQMALVARAKAIHRRLWLAQNRLALRFPIHLLVTECEAVPGFASFGAALPESLRRSMLGWASPYELVAPFRIQWVDSAMDQIVGAVADTCAELCALETADAGSSAYFLLPSEVERLRAGLKIFCEELMRPSAYHESFLLRGIYLTGDAGAAALLQAGAAGLDATPLVQLPALATAAGEREAGPRAAMPVFLRDIFERKIFAEVGLVRSSSQHMRRPATTRLAWWAALLVPMSWGLGLGVATFQLHQRQGVVLAYLAGSGTTTQVAAPGVDATPAQRRAIAALDSVEQMRGARFSSVFMPGSWPLFDDLQEQLQRRLEQGFAVDVVSALRHAAVARVGRLTGAVRDPATGDLLDNGECKLPAHWSEQGGASSAGLGLKDVPEYNWLLGYLASLDELDQAIGAMQRLGPSAQLHKQAPASGADLALAVRVLLKREVGGMPTRTAALYRAAAQGIPVLPLGPLEAAARCALRLGETAMYRRLFEDNSLLLSEQAVTGSLARLRDSTHQGADLGARLRLWQTLRTALDNQQSGLVTGQGGWMHERVLDLGSAQDNLLKQIGANRLLGPVAVRDSRNLAAQGFGRFKVAWERVVAAPDQADGGAGLAWDGTSWVFTPERKALHSAVAALMAQPYMRAAATLRLPVLGTGATIGWDRAQLEQAASLPDARKAFQGGAYIALPTSLQQPAAAVVDLALGASASAALAQALSVAPPQLPSAAADAERAVVLRIRAWLREIGARQLADDLDAALERDALSRLARLDEVFDAAQLYVPRDAGFQQWQGQKGAMLGAFGGDVAGLNAYLEQQQEFIDTMVQQAEGVLAELASGASGGHPLVASWQALAADLRRYRLKSPTSSRMALETFIAIGSAEIDINNCVDKLALRQPPRRAADVFAERLQSLQVGMLARCRELASGDDQRQWQHFAEAYNRELGKRAPFVTFASARSGGADAVPADLEAVGAVLKLYDRARAAGALAERDPGQPGARPAVRKADQQLRRVRDLLAPLYPAEEGQVGALDVTVEFRANTGGEAGANKIIDWGLTIGGATVRLADRARALRWEPGMIVADRTVSYRFDDPWALFSFINAYRDGGTPGDDGRVPLLRFEFPLVSAEARPSSPLPQARARVFLRMRVSAPGKHAALTWPALFPAQVPPWQEPLQSAL
ncbi:type VI secretion protein IcmF/TssM N-terminal domain-containing protein [Massilia sp. CMS3.1]|uniref:type VI secretion protein IcmF/TssM N-terminal domain-containing protein n=1 Tax=Massilia sp. CMS3.1 TaxID=3373083 RepID=UPI003EE7E56E